MRAHAGAQRGLACCRGRRGEQLAPAAAGAVGSLAYCLCPCPFPLNLRRGIVTFVGLLNYQEFWPFAKPVDCAKEPRYLEVLNSAGLAPMDLGAIKREGGGGWQLAGSGRHKRMPARGACRGAARRS